MAAVKHIVLSENEIRKRYNSIKEIMRVGSGSAHTHPESEFIKVHSGKVVIAYIEEGEIRTFESSSNIFIEGGVPHQAFIKGTITVHTTKKNLANIEKRRNIEDFISS